MMMIDPQKVSKDHLWYLNYDTQCTVRSLLSINLKKYLNKIISSENYGSFEVVMRYSISNYEEWNDRCWKLIQLFEYLNTSFELDTLDDILLFIQEKKEREVVGRFRLWIDLERLYMFCFLKLDNQEFQEDRIYMCLFRTLLYLNELLNQYSKDDFNEQFIQVFLNKVSHILKELHSLFSTYLPLQKLTKCIMELMQNYANNEPTLIDTSKIDEFRRNSVLKAEKAGHTINEIERRFQVMFENEEMHENSNKIRSFAQTPYLDELSKYTINLYDPRQKMIQRFENKMYQMGNKVTPQQIDQLLKDYEKEEKGKTINVFELLNRNHHNPYLNTNYLIYGHSLSLNLENRTNYEVKGIEKKNINLEGINENKYFYEKDFEGLLDSVDRQYGNVHSNDLKKMIEIEQVTNRKKMKEGLLKDNGENKLTNLKWGDATERALDTNDTEIFQKRYENNALFKNEFDELVELKKEQDRWDNRNVSKTIENYEQEAARMREGNYSFGKPLFTSKGPLMYSLKTQKTIQRTKYDFLRKTLQYNVANKKIKKLIAQTRVPSLYPRTIHEIEEKVAIPWLKTSKVDYALGWTQTLSEVYF